MEKAKTLLQQFEAGYIDLDPLIAAHVNAQIKNPQDHFQPSSTIYVGDSRWRWFRDLLLGYKDKNGEMFTF